MTTQKFFGAFFVSAIIIIVGFIMTVTGASLTQLLGIVLMTVGVFSGVGADLALSKDS